MNRSGNPHPSAGRPQRAMRLVLGVALLATLLGGCGFRLQGRQVLPASLAVVLIEAKDEQSEFIHSLRSLLATSGARLTRSAGPDVATVQVLRDEVIERVLSVSSRNTPTDYEITYEVELRVSGGGRELLATEAFSLSRVYSFDERRLLAKEREEEILREALARDMASVVARRLASL